MVLSRRFPSRFPPEGGRFPLPLADNCRQRRYTAFRGSGNQTWIELRRNMPAASFLSCGNEHGTESQTARRNAGSGSRISDFDDAFRMLSELRGTWHYVATGVALVCAGAEKARVFVDVTKVYFKNYSDEELTSYLMTPEAYDKAGGYAIQGYFARYTEKIEGSYDNVVGFPWERITEEIKRGCRTVD